MKKNLLLLVALMLSSVAFSQDDVKIVVTGDRVSLRAAPDANAVLLGRMMLGDKMVLKDNGNADWVGVQPPETVDLWVNSEFVSNNVVATKLLNIRSGPSRSHSVVGSAFRGDVLTVRGEIDDWLKIAPTSNTVIWISRKYAEAPRVMPVEESVFVMPRIETAVPVQKPSIVAPKASAVKKPAVVTPPVKVPAVQDVAPVTPPVKAPAVKETAVVTPPPVTPPVKAPAVKETAVVTPPPVTPPVKAPAVKETAVVTPPPVTPPVKAPAVKETAVVTPPPVTPPVKAPAVKETAVVTPPSVMPPVKAPAVKETAVVTPPSVTPPVKAPAVKETAVVTPPPVTPPVKAPAVQETVAVTPPVEIPAVSEKPQAAQSISAMMKKLMPADGTPLSPDRVKPQGAQGSYAGVLKPENKLYYKLVDEQLDDVILCYVRGNSAQMKDFDGMKLEITGKVYWADGMELPVIVPSRIKPVTTK